MVMVVRMMIMMVVWDWVRIVLHRVLWPVLWLLLLLLLNAHGRARVSHEPKQRRSWWVLIELIIRRFVQSGDAGTVGST
jgi:hypothetical protein